MGSRKAIVSRDTVYVTSTTNDEKIWKIPDFYRGLSEIA
jgi:hypothetical protein